MGLPVPSRWGILCRQAVEGENKPVSGIGCGGFFWADWLEMPVVQALVREDSEVAEARG